MTGESAALWFCLIELLIGMPTTSRATRSFSLDGEVLAEIKRTRGTLSQSERESASFYASQPSERAERRAFQSASIRSLARD
jgi:hypothetical protein